MSGFLLKPVTPAALLKCLGYRLGERAPVKSIRPRGETALAPDLELARQDSQDVSCGRDGEVSGKPCTIS